MEHRTQISTSAFGLGRYVFSLLHKKSYRPHGCAIIAYNDLDLHRLYMANKRVSMKTDDGEWQFWADIV